MNDFTPTATLITGTVPGTQSYAHSILQKAFCSQKGCSTCITCMTIRSSNSHYALLWITPEKKYTLDLLEPIFKRIGFCLQPEEQFFFVLESSQLLSASCANSLLKIVEEPPHGYHFLFLATDAHLVIPTIRSRCHHVRTEEKFQSKSISFLRHFLEKQTNPTLFLKELQTEAPEDFEVPHCLSLLIDQWTDRYMHALTSNDTHQELYANRILVLLQKTAEHPPMPGSAKIFWRNLYLQLHGIS